MEDLTESLTADERGAASDFPEPTEPTEPPVLPARADAAVARELGDPVTAALRLPSRHAAAARPEWRRARQPQTERLLVPAGLTIPLTSAQRRTAVMPHLGRGLGEAATTTVTLPPPGSALELAAGSGADQPRHLPRGRWVALGVGAILSLFLAALAGHALTLAELWPGAAAPPPRAPHSAYRERLIEQALAALRDGRREQAVGLLLRHQASEPSPDRTVEIMLRVLKKDLGTPSPRLTP